MISPLAMQVVPPRLRETLAAEQAVCERLEELNGAPTGDAEVDALIDDLSRASATRTDRLAARLHELAGELPPPMAGDGSACAGLSASGALREAFELMGRMMIAYSALAPVANRVRDSTITAHDGMTGHAARDGMQECLMAMGKIAGMIQAVVLRELVEDGVECQCTCPACGLGLCVCGNGMKAATSEAWMAARPAFEAAETAIPRPRSTSAAAAAGFQEGDSVVAVDGVALKSYPQLQTSIKAHEMGEVIEFQVQRGSTTKRIGVERGADVGDSDLPLDCEAPSGEAFYLDRARDLQQRLRRSNGNGASVSGLAVLSTRETQVLRLLVDGATNPMIAAKLHIQRPTVARHVQNILMKLDVSNRAEAAAIGAAAGLRSDL